MDGQIAGQIDGHISIENMLLNADPVVQAVMLILFLASLVSWIIIFEKAILLRGLRRRVHSFKEGSNQIAQGLAADVPSELSQLVMDAGLQESQDDAGRETRADYRERVERTMRTVLAGRINQAGSKITFLATAGATCPFIGLFGTVWGIMHSFVGIAATGETTLAVVAPGIAEALLATALGLVAAIPAVIAYNKINGSLKKINREGAVAIAIYGNHLARLHFMALDQESGKNHG